MKLRTLLLSCILFVSYVTCFGQSPTKLFRTNDGKLYSVAQKDSIAALGHAIGEISLTIVRDTSFIDIEIYAIAHLDSSAFVQKYKNKKLSAFRVKTMDGKTLDSESLRGKVVMINFWSTTCGPCIKEMPELNQLKDQYKDVVFLAFAPESPATVKKLLAKHPLNFVIIPGAKSLFEEWGIDSYPKNFFVDQDGIIREVKEATPFYRPTKTDEWELAVVRTYSPILAELQKR
jgi:thiol-disulfide isomerase/thioredoxin